MGLHHVAPHNSYVLLPPEKRKRYMQQETTISQAKTNELAPKMESQELRRACSEISHKLEKLVMISTSKGNPRPNAATSSSTIKASASEQQQQQQQVTETVRCACCGVAEECTAAYIRGVRASFCGDWLCGLCAEAVKEIVRRDDDPAGGGVAAALVAHEAECRDFNATTRLNPTLSLAGSMRRIARRSFDRRAASCQERSSNGAAPAAAALTRSTSCDPWFLSDTRKGPAGDRCR